MADRIICLRPFYLMEFGMRGRVFCCCPIWLQGPLGDLSRSTIQEVWNGPRYVRLREGMLNGQWGGTCRPDCPTISAYRLRGESVNLARLEEHDEYPCLTPKLIEEIRAGKTHLESTPTMFKFGNSPVCNLDCIMCHAKEEKQDHELVQKTVDDVWSYLPHAKELLLTGHGEALARSDSRKILLEFDGPSYPDVKIDLITNGLLLPQYWDRIKHQNFGWMNISIDAATKETYEIIRRRGNWEVLMEALQLVKENRHRFSDIVINMTVSKANYREIPMFLDLAEQLGAVAWFSAVRLETPPADMPADWCFFNDPYCAEYREFQDIVRNCMSRPRQNFINWNDLLPYIK